METSPKIVNKAEMQLLEALANANIEASKIRGTVPAAPVAPTKAKEEAKPAVQKQTRPTVEFSEIEKKKMDALNSLAKTNLEVSKAKELLFEVKKEEITYIKEREDKTLKQVDKILAQSNIFLSESLANYQSVQDLTSEAVAMAQFLTEIHSDFIALRTVFDEKTVEWEKSVKETEKKFEEIKKQIKIDQVSLKNSQEALAREIVLIKKEKIKIADERQTLERAIKRLKNNQI